MTKDHTTFDTQTLEAHSPMPFSETYETRRAAFLNYARTSSSQSLYYEVARIAGGATPHEGIIVHACDFIDARHDCSDFRLHGLLRLLYQCPDALDPDLEARVRETVLRFKYWPDEPGVDDLCTWTENHQILYASAAYLAGQLFPDETFTNAGHTGREKQALARPRIMRWLDLRFRTGFSEWLSNVYYDEDLVALINLADFVEDAEIQQRATMVIDMILFDIAINSFKGVFGSTHGRTYESSKKWAVREGTTNLTKLLFGVGTFTSKGNLSAPCFALSPKYRMPRVLYEIANDPLDTDEHGTTVNRQRMGLKLSEIERWDLHTDNYEDGMVFLSLEAYMHPKTAALTLRMFDAFNWWENGFFKDISKYKFLLNSLRVLGLLRPLLRLTERDVCRNTREEVNVYTYRTPHYMLSSALDYRKGYGGDQQHIWQATLGPDAVCFTTDPPNTRRDQPTPNYWTGSGTLPRVAQVENVVIAIYKLKTGPGLYVTNKLKFTHAWLPRDKFDEVVEQDEWVFARKADAYLALRSQQPYQWQTQEGEDQGRELIATGKDNIWICELGSQAETGSFEKFIKTICAAPLTFKRSSVEYHSPSQGNLRFSWNGPFYQNGHPHDMQNFPRYDNVYTWAAFPANQVHILHKEEWLRLDWDKGTRQLSESTASIDTL